MSQGVDPRLPWRRSKRCSDSACVEMALVGDHVLVRSSDRPHETVRFTKAEWTAFVAGVQDGDFPL